MNLVKKGCGIYKKLENGSASKVGFDTTKCLIKSGDLVGLGYYVEFESGALTVEVKYVFPNGEIMTRQIEINQSQEMLANLIFEDINIIQEGNYRYEVKLLDYPEIKPIVQEFSIYPLGRSVLFSNLEAKKPTTNEISEFETKHNCSFCDDYRNFLLEKNGFSFIWWSLPEWSDLSNLPNFWTALNSAFERTEWIDEVDTLFGLNRPDAYYDLERDLTNAIPKEFLPLMYPIGIDGGGNLLLQISQGSRKGKMLMLDHEVSCILNDLLQVKNRKFTDTYNYIYEYPFDEFTTATPDQIIDACITSGAMHFIDLDFKQVYERLENLYLLAYQKMKNIYPNSTL